MTTDLGRDRWRNQMPGKSRARLFRVVEALCSFATRCPNGLNDGSPCLRRRSPSHPWIGPCSHDNLDHHERADRVPWS